MNGVGMALKVIDGKEARCRGARHIEVQIQGVLMNIEAFVDWIINDIDIVIEIDIINNLEGMQWQS